MEKRDVSAGLVFVAIALCGLALVTGMPSGAAIFPVAVLSITVVLGAALTLRGLSGLKKSAPSTEQPEALNEHAFFIDPLKFIIGLSATTAYVLMIQPLGFYTATALFIVVTSVLLGERRPILIISSATFVVGLIYAVFGLLFERPLPEEWLLKYETGLILVSRHHA